MPRQIEDKERLVWTPLPSHSGYGDYPSWYFFYSLSTVKLLRHGNMHSTDGSVCTHKYANAMYGMMMKVGSYYGQFN